MATKSRRDHCATTPIERQPLVTVKEVPDGSKWQWVFVDAYSATGQHLSHALKYGTGKQISAWLAGVVRGAAIVDKEAIEFLQAKNGTGRA